MHRPAAPASMRLPLFVLALGLAALSASPRAAAQDDTDYGSSDDDGGGYGGGGYGGGGYESGGYEEPSFTVNGMFRLQSGVFAPMFSSKFKPHENTATNPSNGMPCDVRLGNTQCVPTDHGQEPGTLSIMRMTLQMEAQWDISDKIGLHAIVRGVRSMSLPGDEYGRPPQQDLAAWRRRDFAAMGDYSRDWAQDNLYTEFDLREFYLDLFPKPWLSMRIGRQQIMWGDVGGYRLLDAVNPENTTWHFGPLEAVEDVRIPLWMWLTTIDIPAIDHSLELLWVPMIDRPKDTVTTPLSFVGAWGVPYSNAPTSFFSPNLNFKYPGGRFQDQRAGLRWKGNLGTSTNYSLVYLYTHQFSPPVPTEGYFAQSTRLTGMINPRDPMSVIITEQTTQDPTVTQEITLEFPRQHIAGFSLEQSLSRLATIARLEAAVEPNRTFSGRTDAPIADPTNPYRITFRREQMMAINYAFVLQRPTMIRFLNPTQNFLLVAQFFHSVLPTLDMDSLEGRSLVNLVSYNQWQLQKHSYRVVALARTNYFKGLLTLNLMGVYMPNPYAKDSGFYTIDVGFRLGAHYRLNIVATDFVGKDPYRDLGLFRDRDEILANLTILF